MENERSQTGRLLSNLAFDIPAGLVVYLVALPLCLGIALASGAPLFAGVVAGIVGGLVIGTLSGSQTSVSGPAAGLAVIVASSIATLGDFSVFLVAVVMSGVFQIILGVVRAGLLAEFVPTSVVKGMLSAIGLVIIMKQIPYALGQHSDYEGSESFVSAFSNSNTILDLLHALLTIVPTDLFIALASLGVLLLWEAPQVKNSKILSILPGPLVAVAIGVFINEMLHVIGSHHVITQDSGGLVSIPVVESIEQYRAYLPFPDFSSLARQDVWIVALTLAIVGSIESLLSVEAADKLDPYRRISDMNRELLAQGIGNIVSGLVGGLPVTSVIVRSSTNIYAGTRSRLSAILHGGFLLTTVALIPQYLNRIPLSSLAMVLIVVGYKLTKPSIFVKAFGDGMSQFIPFVTTVIAVVLTDLLTGVCIGLVVGLFFVIRANYHAAFTIVSSENTYLFRFNKDLSFVNKWELKQSLRSLPDNSSVLLDGTQSRFIDKDILDVIDDFLESAKFRDIKVECKHITQLNTEGGK